MRRRITPALALFSALLFVLLAIPRSRSTAAIAAALLPAAASVALLAAADPIVRRAGLLLVSAAADSRSERVPDRLRRRRRRPAGCRADRRGGVHGGSSRRQHAVRVTVNTARVRVREASTRDGIDRGSTEPTHSSSYAGTGGSLRERRLRSGPHWRHSSRPARAVRGGVARDDIEAPDSPRHRGACVPASATDWHRAIAETGFRRRPSWRHRSSARARMCRKTFARGSAPPAACTCSRSLACTRESSSRSFSLLLRPVRSRLAVFLVGSFLLAVYLFVAGLMPSLVRAVVMLTVGGAARLADRDDEPLNLLAIAGVVIIAADPFAAATLSFQLSFLALAGILSLGPILERPLEGRIPAFSRHRSRLPPAPRLPRCPSCCSPSGSGTHRESWRPCCSCRW